MPRPQSQQVMGTSYVAGGPQPSVLTKSAPPTELDPAGVRPRKFNAKERAEQFHTLRSYNFRVLPRVEHEVLNRWVEDLAQTVRIPVTKRRATHIAGSLKTEVPNEIGQMVPHHSGHTIELPFTTFDNAWQLEGFSPRDIAWMLWNMPGFGTSFIMIPMSDEEVNLYWEQKQSPQVVEAQNRALDESFVEETIRMQEDYMTTPSVIMEGSGFQLPPLPA